MIVVKKIKPSKKSNGLNIYTYKTYTKQFSFMVTPYENISNNCNKTTTELTFKGKNHSVFIAIIMLQKMKQR